MGPRVRLAQARVELVVQRVERTATCAAIGTILERGSAQRQGQALVPTFTAFAVTALLEEHFPHLVDEKFTARMEETLDEISEGHAEWLPYLLVGVAMLALLTLFWSMRLADNPSLLAGTPPPSTPLSFVRRFASQPRLVLSWILALGRNGWWVMFFMCVPIYATSVGYSPEVGGALVSLGLAG